MTPKRRPPLTLAAAVGACAVAFTLPLNSSAHAATVTSGQNFVGYIELHFNGKPGEQNDVTLTDVGLRDVEVGGQKVYATLVVDLGAELHAEVGCRQLSTNAALCGAGRDFIYLGAEHDRVLVGDTGPFVRVFAGAGDDVIDARPDVRPYPRLPPQLPINGATWELNGEKGSDRIYGSPYVDLWISGGDGPDTINPGLSADVVSGDAGRDQIRTFDLEADEVACGLSLDTVVADSRDVVASDCENVSRAL